MAEHTIDQRIDEGTVEAFETVCGVLGHNVIGQFSIFDGAWQVVLLAVAEEHPTGNMTPAEHTQLREAVAATMPLVESVMQINEDIRAFLFPQMVMLPDHEQLSERERNQARWSPYDRAAWNTFFAGVRDRINRTFGLLDQIDERIAGLRDLNIDKVLESYDHFEPMLAANLRERLEQVIDTYTLDPT